ncbi:nucleoside hydrolase [Gellertiella hungarica]|uniref:Inosine-uridine nucleoside N-ribohydrolase n=1 Tax=Gellertiella hungarica TaxID=1572859 RepID=A0A7W6J8W0_9HYPH|nr:nucleoside hydrolase [Gellertiella hungarica]MBB4066949.1 inosine-uridine nucleoside N-ribohydrolase [Gellertiella hungarica]
MAHKVIFDTDPGVDDAMALLFLHRHPDIDLVGVTTVFGNASIETTTRNALFLKREWGFDAPVAKGADETIDPSRPHAGWPTFIHGDDGLGNIGVPDTVDVPLDPRPAYQFIIDTVRANPHEITLVAVGRMTNLALALRHAPDIAHLVKQVVIMGGAFDVPGNVTPAAEANIHGDPEAADIVFAAPWKVVAAGLDVTTKTTMSRGFLDAMAEKGGADVELLRRVSDFYIKFYSHAVDDGMLVHDSCACVYVVAPGLFTVRSGAVRVVCGGLADGQTIQKPDGMSFGPSEWDGKVSQQVMVGVDADKVLALLARTLTA